MSSAFKRDTTLSWQPANIALPQLEKILFISLYLISLFHLFVYYNDTHGFDSGQYLAAFSQTHWFKPIPSIKQLTQYTVDYSYHPPLAYLMQRILNMIVKSWIHSAKWLSWLTVLGGLTLLRASLKRTNLLFTIPGVVFFYCVAALPVIVNLTVSITNDSVIFFWMMTTLYLSIMLFWQLNTHQLISKRKRLIYAALLILSIAAGMLTKYSGLLACSIPMMLIIIRHVRSKPIALSCQAVLITLLGILLVSPFYYSHYYKTQHHLFPVSEQWTLKTELQQLREQRDQNPIQFIIHMVRIPKSGTWEQRIPTTDSFFHSIWLQTWKRDAWLGHQSNVSSTISDIYAISFIGTTLLGSIYFFYGYRRRATAWNHFGWLLLWLLLLFSTALLYFGWNYPVWRYRPFKAKYMVVALLWVPYCAATLTHHLLLWTKTKTEITQQIVAQGTLALTALFLFINYLLPVF